MVYEIKNLNYSKLVNRYTELEIIEKDIVRAINILANSFERGGKLVAMGNGGSSADAEHICGELVKSFVAKRKLTSSDIELLDSVDTELAKNLQGSLPAISLGVNHSTVSAFSNDMSPEFCFAQQVWGLANQNDTVLGISTSGNSANVVHALKVAKAKGIATIGLTGEKDSLVSQIVDVCIMAPASITHFVQEFHLPIYHAICLEVENLFFPE